MMNGAWTSDGSWNAFSLSRSSRFLKGCSCVARVALLSKFISWLVLLRCLSTFKGRRFGKAPPSISAMDDNALHLFMLNSISLHSPYSSGGDTFQNIPSICHMQLFFNSFTW